MAATPDYDVVINRDGAIVIIIRRWLQARAQADYPQILHDYLNTYLPWNQIDMNMYDKVVRIPRTMFFMGNNDVKTYGYSYVKFPMVSWDGTGNDSISKLCREVRTIRDYIQADPILYSTLSGNSLSFDSCLLNRYASGQEMISAHSDKEALGPFNAVVTVSLGASREFILKSKTKIGSRYETIKTHLHNGDLVLMAGKCQDQWTHAIPRDKTVITSRISLTYRLISK